MKRQKSKKRKIKDIIRIIVLLIALCVLIYPSVSSYLDEKNSSKVVSNYDKNIQPGTTLNIALAFEISDLSDVTLDVSEAFSFSGQKDTMILTLQ